MRATWHNVWTGHPEVAWRCGNGIHGFILKRKFVGFAGRTVINFSQHHVIYPTSFHCVVICTIHFAPRFVRFVYLLFITIKVGATEDSITSMLVVAVVTLECFSAALFQ